MELTLVTIGIIILIILLVRQRNEIKKLRNGLTGTYDRLTHIQSLLEDIRGLETKPPTPDREEEFDASLPEADAAYPPPLPPQPTAVAPIQESTAESRESWFQRFKRNNPDIERFIGENLINKIGIVILVLGISFFVKYAIDKDWIGEPARVGIGILCGAVLLGIAHRLRLLYKAFSSVLVAGAIAVFYFTVGIAFHDYALFGQTTAFLLMVTFTVFSVFVSVAYDRQELGVLSFIGGFAVPFMVSTGDANYHVLFSYLSILNVGMLTVSYFKRWFIVNFTAFALTTVLFAGWYLTVQDDALPQILLHGLAYSSFFYMLFSVAFVLNNVVHKNKFAGYEIGALITNAAVYYAAGHHVLHMTMPQYVGLYTVLLGVYNMVFAFVIYRKYKFDRNIIYVLIGLALTLATVAIPVQFEGHYITIFWACEAVLLFWLTKKSHLRGFTLAGILVQALALVSLLIDLSVYMDSRLPHSILHVTFLTGMIVIGSLIGTYRLFKRHDYSYTFAGVTLDSAAYRKLILNMAILLGYLLPLVEVTHQAHAFFVNPGTIRIFLYLYHIAYTTGLIVFSNKDVPSYTKWVKIIAVCNMLLYVVVAYRIPLMEKEHVFYNEQQYAFPYAMVLHYLSLGCLLYQVWRFTKATTVNEPPVHFTRPFIPWFVAFFIVFLCSVEVNIGFSFFTDSWEDYFHTKNFVVKVILPILWGVLSFGLLLVGIRLDIKSVRVIALTLLGLTIFKLFVYDIRDVSETGKIIAFILLGVLILVISFVYQKIKKLIVDNHEKDTE